MNTSAQPSQLHDDIPASDGEGTTRALATFLAGLQYEDLPIAVVRRAEELFLDWIASALGLAEPRALSPFSTG